MSRRESRTKPAVLIAVGGVNERVGDVELPSHEYSKLNGLFPEFAGLQSRLFGKRLLQKYPDAIYGIHQFWTPMGYGGGLYQFDGTLDIGQWLTPTSKFDLTPPLPGIDGGGMTLDEFGYWYGPSPTSDVNTCVMSFLNGSSDHSDCNPPPSPANTPNDNNGGPAGQGKKCKWTDNGDDTEYDIEPFAVSGSIGSSIFATFNTDPPWNEPLSPTPLPRRPPPQEAGPSKPTYSGTEIRVTGSISSQSLMGAVGPTWFFRYEGAAFSGEVVFDFTSIVSNPLPGGAEIQVEHRNQSGVWQPAVWVPIQMTFEGEPSSSRFDSYKLDTWDYMQWGYFSSESGGNGWSMTDEIRIKKIRFKYRVRVCA